MYRYLLFQCDTYYPAGGMYDCKLKTNNLEDLIPFINKHYNEELWGNIHYYDAVEDKIYNAIMEKYQDENYFDRQRFIRWEITDGILC